MVQSLTRTRPALIWGGPRCAMQGHDRTKFVFQGVHETVCFGPTSMGWRADEEPLNQIVFIGRDLDRQVTIMTHDLRQSEKWCTAGCS